MASPFSRAEHRVMRSLARAIFTALSLLACALLAVLWFSVSLYWLLEPRYGSMAAAQILAAVFLLIIAVVFLAGAIRRRLRRRRLTPDPLLFLLGSLYEFRDTSPIEAQTKTAEAVLAEMLADFVRRSEARR